MEIEVVSELIEQYGTEVMIFCRRLTGCVPDAQDLYQQTFLKLMEMRVRIEREKNPRAFIFAVANSIWKNERRKLMRRALIANPGCTRTARHRGHPAVGDRADLPTTAFVGSAAAGTEISDTDPFDVWLWNEHRADCTDRAGAQRNH